MSEKPEVDNEGFATSFTMFCTTIIVINVSMIICGAMVFVAVKVKSFSLWNSVLQNSHRDPLGLSISYHCVQVYDQQDGKQIDDPIMSVVPQLKLVQNREFIGWFMKHDFIRHD